MDNLLSILTHRYFLSFIFAWLFSVLLKTVLESVKSNKFRVFSGLKTGGMPSSHSAVASALTVAIFINEGATAAFFVALVFSLIVINDAFMVRRNVGLQGDELNSILRKFKKKPLEVIYGHTFFQTTIGIVIGVACAVLISLI